VALAIGFIIVVSLGGSIVALASGSNLKAAAFTVVFLIGVSVVAIRKRRAARQKYWVCRWFDFGESEHSQERVLSDKALERARKKGLRIEVIRGPFDSEDEADKRQELLWEAMMDAGED
jgi:hypothetical protein